MYPSDYGYSADSSYWKTKLGYGTFNGNASNSSWLQMEANHSATEWFLSPSSYDSYIVAVWYSAGNVNGNSTSSYSIGVRPSLNLKSKVSIIDGSGEKGTPYELGIYNVTELKLNKEFGYTTPNSSTTFKVTSNNEGTFEVISKSPKIASASIETNSDKEATITVKGLQEGNARIIVNFKPKDNKYNESSISYSIIVTNSLIANVRGNITEKNSVNDGEITYLSGDNDTINFNYVWYSGKLWRITAINKDDTIKMITQDGITAIYWGEDITYKDSWIHQWLNEDFLDTLENQGNIMVQDAKWYATADSNEIPVKPEGATIDGKVGLLNAYEYTQAYKNASDSTNYLNIGYSWWLLTPYNGSDVRRVLYTGVLSYRSSSSYAYAVRPSIILKSDIKISGGDGSKKNPYRIEGDKEIAKVDDKLNSRVSGEYVNIDEKKYRIVGIENETTKLTSVDWVIDEGNTIIDKNFGSNASWETSVTSNDDNYWGYYLNKTWYNNMNETYRNMLVEGTYYLGQYGDNVSYKNTICSSSNTTDTTKTCSKTSSKWSGYVGLPRVGEMFSAMLGNGYTDTAQYIWLITPYSSSNVWAINSDSNLNQRSSSSNKSVARPSIYLNSDVVITSGKGTEQKPYEIKCDTCIS